MGCVCFSILLVVYNILGVCAEESDFNRIKSNNENNKITMENTQSFWIQNSGYEYSSYYSMSSVKFEYDFLSKHSILVVLPFAFRFSFVPEKNIDFSWGDVRFEYEYMKSFLNMNLSLGSFVTIPLESIKENGTVTKLHVGSARFKLGLNVLLAGVLDPVVWNLGLEYAIGLPDKNDVFQPANIQLQAIISDLVNERFGFALGIYPYLKFPEIQDGTVQTKTLSLTSFIRLETFVMFNSDYLRFFVDSYTHPFGAPVIFNIVYGHNFKIN